MTIEEDQHELADGDHRQDGSASRVDPRVSTSRVGAVCRHDGLGSAAPRSGRRTVSTSSRWFAADGGAPSNRAEVKRCSKARSRTVSARSA